jgi:RNA ligase (TIGR02306 family)
MRKLATIRKIDNIEPIAGADAIECAVIGGWRVVIKKNEYAVGDLAVYFEIDSWIPTELAPFLSKGKEPREFEGIKGERLRTVKLRGQLSQGLLLNLDHAIPWTNSYQLDEDVSEVLGIIKWERPMNAQLAGMAKGNFPSLIPKTDQERVQNLKNEINAAIEAGLEFEVTEKLEGSSMTAYMIDGEFGVCSRNMDLKQDENNSFWQVAINDNIELKIRSLDMDNIAIQGELVGPGIQGNIYNLSKHEFYVFDVYDIKGGCYLNPKDREAIIARIGLKHVPVIWHKWKLAPVDAIIAQADASSFLNKNQAREGIVFKQIDGGMTFKAISNKYLMGEKD